MDEPAWDGTRDQVRDSSGQGHHGTSVAGASTVTGGRFSRAGSFAGGTSCVTINDVPDLRPSTQLTVAAWVFPTGLGRNAAMGIVAKRFDFLFDSAYALFFNTDDRLTADVNTEDNRFGSGSPFANGRWYHVAMVYDGAARATTVFMNGDAFGAGAESASIRAFTSPVWVGCLAETNPSQGFSGLIDEVAVWHRALSGTEIRALATATGPVANP